MLILENSEEKTIIVYVKGRITYKYKLLKKSEETAKFIKPPIIDCSSSVAISW